MPFASAQNLPKLEFKAPEVGTVSALFISGVLEPINVSRTERVHYKYLSNR